MNGIVLFIIILLILYCAVSWLLPRVLAFLFERKFKVILSIGRIGIPYLKLCDINISRKGFTIHIEEISIKSSFFNSELTKLVTLVVKDVRINKDVPVDVKHYESGLAAHNFQQNLDFRNKKIPHFITTFAQFMAIHVYNVSVMLLRSESPAGLVHTTASELHLDGSVLQNARTLLVNVNLTETCTKILQHSPRHVNEDTCLGEFSFAIALEATLVAQGHLSFENLQVIVYQTNAVINEGFYTLFENSTVKHSSSDNSSEENNLYNRLAPIIPKNLTVKIEDTTLKGVTENNRIDFNSSLQSFSFSCRFTSTRKMEDPTYLPNMQFSFLLTHLQVHNSKEKILMLKSLGLNAELESNIINIFLNLDTLLATYSHEVIYKWFKTNFMAKRKRSLELVKTNKFALITANKVNSDVRKVNMLERLIKKCIINGCIQFDNIAALIKLNGNHSWFGLTHVKLILHQTTECRGASYVKYMPRLLLSDRHWQAEMLLESLSWSFKDWKLEENISKKVHIWGTPFYLGMALVKIETLESRETKVESLLDTLQLEWSQNLSQYILFGIKCIKDYNVHSFQRTPKTELTSNLNYSLTLKLTHLNCFLESKSEEYIVIRLDTIQIDKVVKTSTIVIENLKLLMTKSNDGFYNCVRCEDVINFQAHIKCAQIEHLQDEASELHIELLEEIICYWSCNFHLKMLTFIREFETFYEQFKIEMQHSDEQRIKKSGIQIYNVHMFGIFAFYIEISQNHSAKIALDDMTLSYNKENFSVLNNTIMISIDGADIFTIQGLNLSRILNSDMIRNERLDNENFQLPWNKTWGLTIDLFRVCFPYEHSYADAVQNEFVTVFKWLKIEHRKAKVPFTANSPLPKDVLLNVKEFLFELSDDPFEGKLRDNFVLLVDEYSESLKRRKMLKDRVAELCKTHLHLPAGKVEELYATLNKKNAEVYVQRSKQLNAEPPRTRLFAWSMTGVEIMVLADPSIHGTENVVHIMREIDPDTPWPEEGLEFSTLWCRVVSLRCLDWTFSLRDFPQPLLGIKNCYIYGPLVGAEQVSPRRAIRTVTLDLGEPWGTRVIERGMQPLKFYHDFNCEIQSFRYAFGPCWEPVIAQCDLSLDKIFPPSKDPSAKLSFWDKMRLIYHGRLTMIVQQLTVLLHASLDPYNTTEEMELTWSHVVMDWTNAKFVYKGDLNISVRTASKYDDLQLLHLPNLKLVVNIQWLCLGDPNDHHNVIYCAPNKIPEYSINQVHDSFRAFRSQNMNLSILMETKPVQTQASPNFDVPVLSFYGSTLRWFENLKLILSGVTRPTRRGKIFGSVRPKKTQLSRHYKKIHLLMGLHKFQVHYWMSFAMQRGCELLGGRLSSSSEHILSLIPIDDGLKHRPKAEWSIMYMNSELNDSEIWLKSALKEEEKEEPPYFRRPVEKCYCLSVAKVSYGRETVMPSHGGERNKDTPTHRLVVYDLKGAWTKSNRNVVLALFDTFIKNKQMKKNLSTEALKGFRKENNTTPLKRRNAEAPGTPPNPAIQALQSSSSVQDTPSPLSKLQSGHAANMLQQLIAEAENKAVVFSDDLSSATRQQQLQGLQACQEDDIQHKNWLIALVNAQVLLKGCETKGYVILSAAKAEILQRIHRPAWKDRTLVSKTTWVGTLECLQYYATVNAGENDTLNVFTENIMWLTVDNIQEKESTVISEIPQVPNMVGSGVSVGAVVSDTVGASSVGENSPIQLQRIVSRCKCEFFYASYGDISVDPATVAELPPPLQEDVGPWERRQSAVDAFTLMHHDLDACTNSLQYGMLLDIVNNLLLYVEPHRKEALERLARMRFQLQLHSVEDQRRPIQNLQTQVRSSVSKLRKIEKDTYLVNKTLIEDPDNKDLKLELERLERLVYECKNQLNAQSEELDMMLSCYKESQLLATNRLATLRSDKPLTIVRANEIFFKHAQWRLTEADGQIGIADLVLSNFLYTKNSKSDDSVEHLLELGYLRMTNLLPNQIYKEVLCPTEIQSNMPVEHKKVLRIFCREKPPVGGISVKEHFEINVVPLTIALTKKFYNTMLKFCFPERDPDNIEGERGEEIDADSRGKKLRSSGKRNRDSNFYIPIDDVEKMKERAEKNKLFIYIKIPELPVRLSYKGNKEKNLEDIRDFSIVIPTAEYHNVTWTWLDLLMAIRSDSRKVILSQAIKQKLQIKRNISSDESSSPHEEDKARMLFGTKHITESKQIKKGVGSVFKFSK